MTIGKYSAFIDLLGSKESANLSHVKFSEAISKFSDVVAYSSELLETDARILLFSDCAFIAFSNLDSFSRYICSVRFQLFNSGFFFKCAVVPGELAHSNWKIDRRKTASADKISDIVRGTTFGSSSVEAFLLHEQFKGVGVVVDKHISYRELVETLYFKEEDSNKSAEVVKDFRYSIKEIGLVYKDEDRKFDEDEMHIQQQESVSYLDTFLVNLFSAKAKRKKYGTYYFSALLSMLKSSDFTKIEYNSNQGWVNFPIIFDLLFMKRNTEKVIGDLLGYEFLFIACINEIYNQQNHEVKISTKQKLVWEIVKRPRILRSMSSAPNIVMDKILRNEILSEVSRKIISGKYE